MTIREMGPVLDSLHLPSGPEIIERFDIYEKRLREWNRRINLVSPGDVRHIVEKHFLESIGLVTCLSDKDSLVMDVGTGAGFPGLPLKLVSPSLNLILVESKRKKTLFLKQCVQEMQLSDVQIVNGRMDEVSDSLGPVPLIMSRAVSDAETLLGWTEKNQRDVGGRVFLLKGADIESEQEALQSLQKGGFIKSFTCKLFDPFPSGVLKRKSYILEIVR